MGVPSNPPQKSRGWRSWLKRLLVGSGLLLVLAMVFHAPLLRWVIAVGGAKGAEMAGIKLAWQVDGSVLGDPLNVDFTRRVLALGWSPPTVPD